MAKCYRCGDTIPDDAPWHEEGKGQVCPPCFTKLTGEPPPPFKLDGFWTTPKQPLDPLKSLSPEELAKIPRITVEEIEAALEKGRKAAERARYAMSPGRGFSGTRFR